MKNLLSIFVIIFYIISCGKKTPTELKTGKIIYTFNLLNNGVPVVLNTNLLNPFNEIFKIEKFKFYIHNIELKGLNTVQNKEHFLIDAENLNKQKFQIDLPIGDYDQCSFNLGVDSVRNFSGAQSGALDPLEGMFWTWNSGYILFKLEGTSPQSNQVNNKYEYHIGGYKAPNVVNRKVALSLANTKLKVTENGITQVVINVELNSFFKGLANVKFADMPVVNMPSNNANTIANNYSNLFTIKEILNP